MCRNGYLWISGVNLDNAVRFADPDFLLREKKFSDLAKFSVDCCILYAEYSPYFYFRVVWPTDLESILHASTPTSIIPARLEVDMIIHCEVIAFLSADTSRDLVTLTFTVLTLNSCHSWRVKWSTLPPSMKTLRLSVLELWVITFPVGYHAPNHVTREYGVKNYNNYIFGMLDPDLPIHCATLVALRWK